MEIMFKLSTPDREILMLRVGVRVVDTIMKVISLFVIQGIYCNRTPFILSDVSKHLYTRWPPLS